MNQHLIPSIYYPQKYTIVENKLKILNDDDIISHNKSDDNNDSIFDTTNDLFTVKLSKDKTQN